MATTKQDEADAATADANAAILRSSGIVVPDLPKFDLDAYISNYDGQTRLDRLITIGTSSSPLSADALRLAAIEAQQTSNIPRYLSICSYATSHLPKPPSSSSAFAVDEAWVETQKRKIKAESERLESELRGYKNNLIKESIRMGNEEVGMHYYKIGEPGTAWRHLNRMRDFCTTPKHVAEMALKLILVGVAQDNWLNVQGAVYKIQALQLAPTERDKIAPVLNPCLGLASMAARNFSAAAGCFLNTDPAFATLELLGGVQFNRAVLSPNDIAVYGALCALATLDRRQLKERVLDNTNFRGFLELEPHLRRAIANFVGSKYTAALAILESYRTDYLLDVYLQRHVGELYAQIRRKSIVAYFAPFARVGIKGMGEAFGVHDEAEMEEELVGMVTRGELDARVDAVDKVLVAVSRDERDGAVKKVLDMADETEWGLRLRMMKVNMALAGMGELKSGKDRPGGVRKGYVK